MKPTTTIKTIPPVVILGPARKAIREFGHRHKSKIDATLLEVMVAKQAAEFCLNNATAPWFKAWEVHNFFALEMAPAHQGEAIDQLELALVMKKRGRTCRVTTLTDPLPDEYHVQRVIHEAQQLTA